MAALAEATRSRHILLALAVAWALGWYVVHKEPLDTWIHARSATPATRCIDVYGKREELLIDCEFASYQTWSAYLARYQAGYHDIPFATYYQRYRRPDFVWWWIAPPIAMLIADLIWTIYLAARTRRARAAEPF